MGTSSIKEYTLWKKDTMNQLEIEKRLILFAKSIFDIIEHFPKEHIGAVNIKNQISRSGMSPALNYGKARGAESRRDFIHKMSICLKELRETHIALQIILQMNWGPKDQLKKIINENDQLIAIFVASIITAKKVLRNKNR